MGFDNQKEWEEVYNSSEESHKNIYPSELIIGWIKRNFSSKIKRDERINYKALDLGCGWGNNLKFLKDEGFNAYGIDFSQKAVDALKPEFKENVQVMNFSRLDFEDNSFDIIIDRSAVQHNSKKDIELIFNEVYRVLKPNGRFYSIMAKTKNNDFYMELLDKEDIERITSKFKDLEINYISRTQNNGQTTNSRFLIEVSK